MKSGLDAKPLFLQHRLLNILFEKLEHLVLKNLLLLTKVGD